jgi:hypothetical protein
MVTKTPKLNNTIESALVKQLIYNEVLPQEEVEKSKGSKYFPTHTAKKEQTGIPYTLYNAMRDFRLLEIHKHLGITFKEYMALSPLEFEAINTIMIDIDKQLIQKEKEIKARESNGS